MSFDVATRIAEIKATYESQPIEAISEIDALLSAGGISQERKAALRQLRLEYVAIIHEELRVELLMAANPPIDESLWDQYRYDEATGSIVWEGAV